MQGIDAGGELGVLPVHRQGVLGEVVGADRQKVRFGREQVRGRGRRRRRFLVCLLR
jgi:hypothetical protein